MCVCERERHREREREREGGREGGLYQCSYRTAYAVHVSTLHDCAIRPVCSLRRINSHSSKKIHMYVHIYIYKFVIQYNRRGPSK